MPVDMMSTGQQLDRLMARKQAPPDVAQEVRNDLSDFFLNLSAQYGEVQNPRMIQKYRTWLKVDLYHRGEQFLLWDNTLGSFSAMDSSKLDLHFSVNYFNQIIESLVTEYCKSQPAFRATSRAGDDQRVKDTVEVVQYLIDSFVDGESFWSKVDRQREAHLVLLRGGVFTRVWVDKNAGPLQKIPQYTPGVKTVMPGVFSCPSCGTKGTLQYSPKPGQPVPDDMSAIKPPKDCPSCKNTPISIDQEPVLGQTLTISGVLQVPTGEIRTGPVDPYEVDMSDRATCVGGTPWLRWDVAEDKYKLKEAYPQWTWDPETGSAVGGGDDTNGMHPNKAVGLLYARQIETSTNSLGVPDDWQQSWASAYGSGSAGTASVTDTMTALKSVIYFRPYTYSYKTFPMPQNIPGDPRGLAVPADTPIGQVYPNGAKITFLAGECVKIEDFNIDWEWDFYSTTVPTRGAYGTAAEQGVANQDWINESVSVSYQASMMAAWGLLIANLDRFEKLTTKPGEVSTVKDLEPNEKVGDLIAHIGLNVNTQAITGMIDMAKKDLVGTLGGRDAANAQIPGGPESELATGINYQNSLASSQAGVKLELKAGNAAKQLEQAVRWFKVSQVWPRYLRTMDNQKGRYLKGMDIGHDVTIAVEEDSHQPVTAIERRLNLFNARTKMGYGVMQPDGQGGMKPTNPPWFEDAIANLFQVPRDPSSSDKWNTIAYGRIDAMSQMAEMGKRIAGQGLPPGQAQAFSLLKILQAGLGNEDLPLMLDPQPGQAGPPGPDGQPGQPQGPQPNPDALQPSIADNDDALTQAYLDFYGTDPWNQLDPLVKKAILMLPALHYKAGVRDHATKMAIAKDVMAPLAPPPPPPNESVSIQLPWPKLQPEMQAQVAEKIGMHLTPQGSGTPSIEQKHDMVKTGLDHETKRQALAQPPQPPPTGGVAGGVQQGPTKEPDEHES